MSTAFQKTICGDSPDNNFCTVCGGTEFKFIPVLWDQLIAEWGLSDHEVLYVNIQQGRFCVRCGCNTRVQALAASMCSAFQWAGPFKNFIKSKTMENKKILGINKAGNLHAYLKDHPSFKLVEFPEYDMMKLQLPSKSFDIIVHSDTLEHVMNPLQAMRECFRVLKTEGRLFYTTPTIVDRTSRPREGLSASYHGSPDCREEDYRVYTEFGCDHWKMAFEAGFRAFKIHATEYPAGLAYEAQK